GPCRREGVGRAGRWRVRRRRGGRRPRAGRARPSWRPRARARRRRHPPGRGAPPRASARARHGMTMTTFGVRGEPLAPHTSLRIGGPADFFLRVASEKDLVEAIGVARENELPVFVLGGGTNLLVADRGVRGVVLQNAWREASVD